MGTMKEKKNNDKPCLDHEECIRVLNLIIDGEANKKEQVFFHTHIQDCLHCSHYYTVEQSIREAIRKKLTKKEAPEDLIQSVRDKLKESIRS